MIYINANQDKISTEFVHQYLTRDGLHVPFVTPKLSHTNSTKPLLPLI